ncbi:sensor histidine kinase [Paenibacillus sp. MSJ-34]|uniref:sensor histidine kinase n=1 Tax=Paenibacillus sp. MSJ-34 TaxID=2841529 RepID=UPI001C113D25|nr:sensor histidine kinase [Paenibacillus sp. MSJ-34]MBU5441527.1 sensor histidine kinase [Paenibacillus sp. MSJ-34]
MKKTARYFNWYVNRSIQFKLLFWFVPLLLAMIAIMGWSSYYIASKEVVDKIKQAQDHLTKKTTDQIDLMAKDTIYFANNLFLNAGVQELLTSQDPTPERQKVFRTVSNMMVASNSVQSLILYKLQEGNYEFVPFGVDQTGVTSAMTLEKFQETPYYREAIAADGKPVFHLLKPSEALFVGDPNEKVILTKVIKNIYDLKHAGMMVIGIDAHKIGKQYLEAAKDEADMFVMDREGMIVSATNRQWVGKRDLDLPYFQDSNPDLTTLDRLQRKADRSEWVITYAESPTTGWYVVVIQTKQTLVRELGRIGLLSVTLTVVCLLLSLIVTWMAATMITKPLKKLTRSMKRLQTGDFTQRVNFAGADEIGQLGFWYNTMVQRMKTLIDDMYASQLKQKEAELKTLQAQIRPHFLYNTLNTICWSAERKGEREIADMVYSLSQVFRLSLNDGKDFFTLEQEIELVKHYLFLHKTRYAGQFDFDIELAPEVRGFVIPKLMIQPLVENAVIHGIEPLGGNGHISIRACKEGDLVTIEVLDNGIGMETGRLEFLLRAAAETANGAGAVRMERRSGFALANMRERLQLAFPNAVIELDSTEGAGTCVKIQIQVKE